MISTAPQNSGQFLAEYDSSCPADASRARPASVSARSICPIGRGNCGPKSGGANECCALDTNERGPRLRRCFRRHFACWSVNNHVEPSGTTWICRAPSTSATPRPHDSRASQGPRPIDPRLLGELLAIAHHRKASHPAAPDGTRSHRHSPERTRSRRGARKRGCNLPARGELRRSVRYNRRNG